MSEWKVEEAEYLPLRDVVFHTLRRAILRGELQPGQRLMEIQLADKMGVSRTPVREAIRKLELDGLVVMIPRKGAEVARISGKNLRDVLEVRRALEEFAGELACERMSDAQMAALEQANQQFASMLGSDDITAIAEADEAFHSQIYLATQNERLEQLVNHMREQMYRYRVEHIKDKATRKELAAEHQEIIKALKCRDAAMARKTICAHISRQEEAVARSIRECEA